MAREPEGVRKAKAAEVSRQWREKNRDRWNAYIRSYREKLRDDPARVEQVRLRKRAWYLANHDRELAAQRARHRIRYETEPEAIRDWRRQWRARNPERTRELTRLSNLRRRARGAGDLISIPEWEALLARYDYRCAYCGASGPLEADHRTPLSRGGRHTLENLLPACVRCNRRKHTKTEDEFRRFLRSESLSEDPLPYRLRISA